MQSSPSPAGALAPAAIAGLPSRFRVEQQLGMGAAGIVYEVFDHQRGDRVALKVLRTQDPRAITRFKREFRRLRGIYHRNLARLGELIEAGGRWMFTMELIRGCDLLRYVAAEPAAPELDDTQPSPSFAPIPTPLAEGSAPHVRPRRYHELRLMDAFRQLALGLNALHAVGMLHRDIKSSNVRVDAAGRLVIIDFGLAQDLRERTISDAEMIVGTASYMAPEQAAGPVVDAAADWYAVGVLLYRALTGRPPFEGGPLDVLMAKQDRDPPAPSTVAPGVPAHLEALCMALLSRDPARRPTGDEVVELLGAAGLATDTVATPPAPGFVGRGAELEILRGRLGCRQPTLTVIEGPAGIGKTALVERFAETSGDLVLPSRCYENEQVPYNAIDGLVDQLVSVLRRDDQLAAEARRFQVDVARLFPAFARLGGLSGRGAVADPLTLRRRGVRALRGLFATVAARRRMTVVIDDLQWADRESLELLDALIRPPDAPPVTWIATVRGRVFEQIAARLPALAAAVRIELGPLSPAEARELSGLHLRAAGLRHPELAERVARGAGGHPLLLAELARDASAADRAPDEIRMDRAIARRVGGLDRRARAVLELICLAGAPIARDFLRDACELPESELAAHLELLQCANLVRAAVPRDAVEALHDAVRDSVVGAMDVDARRIGQLRLARAIATGGGDAEAIARHADDGGDSAMACAHYRRAGEQAAHALAFDRAARLFERALALAPADTAGRRDLQVQRGDALRLAGRGVAAAEAYRAAARIAGGLDAIALEQRASWELLHSGHIAEGFRVAGRCLAATGVALPTSRPRMVGEVLWSRTVLALRGYDFASRSSAEIAPESLLRVDVLSSLASVLSLVDPLRAAALHGRFMREVLRTGEPGRVGFGLCLEAAFLSVGGRRSRRHSLRPLQKLCRLAIERRDPYLIALSDLAAAVISFNEGQFAVANRRARRAVARLERDCIGVHWELVTAKIFVISSQAYLGNPAAALAVYRQVLDDAADRADRFASTTLIAAAGFLDALAADQPERGLRELDAALGALPMPGVTVQDANALFARASILLYRGDPAGAVAALDSAWPRLRRSLLLQVEILRNQLSDLRARALLAAAAARGEPAPRQVYRIARRLARSSAPYAAGMALALTAQAAHLSGDTAGAVDRLRRAERAYRDADIHLHKIAMRRARGLLIGGERGARLVASAEAWMRRAGVRNPTRFAGAMTPAIRPR